MLLAGNNIDATRAAMALYDYRRVTRAQFEAFQNQPANQILSTIPEEQRRPLLEVGRSVCRIHIENLGTGTGWHLGSGWVVTNTHVICDPQGLSACHYATFEFPDNIPVPASPRTVLFTKPAALHSLPWRDQQKDLALVHVPEICQWNLPGLNDVMQRSANDMERVYLIHYGNGIDEWPHPQQFSVCENEALFSVSNEQGNVFTVHSAHSRPGSSGAPLLVYEEPMDGRAGKFLVAGVNYCGTSSSILDSPGLALWFNGNNWLQKTVFYTKYAPNGIFANEIECVNNLQTQHNADLLHSAVVHLNKSCCSLQKQLTEDKFRIVVPLRLPNVNDLDPLDSFSDVVWGFE